MQTEAIKQHGKGQGGWLVLLSLKICTWMLKEKNVCAGGSGEEKKTNPETAKMKKDDEKHVSDSLRLRIF